MSETFTGILSELGGAEMGATGREKPRKVIIKQDANQQYGKTFRCWADSDAFRALEGKLGQSVTIEYEVEERTGGPRGSYSQNVLIGIKNGEAAEWPAPISNPAPGSPDWQPPGDEDAPPEVAATPRKTRDEWDERGAQMEAAWALKAMLDVEGPDHGLTEDELLANALRLILLKRRLAFEMEKS